MTATRPRSVQGSIDDAAFVDRVMAAVVAEPVPTPARTFTLALRNGSLGDAVAALATAWHVATLRGRRIGPRVRMRSFALVLSVVAVLAMGGSFATAAAVRVVEHARSDTQGAVVDGADPDRHVAPANDQTDVDEAPATDEVAEPGDPHATPDPDTDDATAEDEPDDADEGDDASGNDESEDADDHDADEADEADEADDPDGSDEADDDEATEDHEESTSGDEAEDDSEHEDADEAEDDPEHEETDEAEDVSEHDESDEAEDAEDAGEAEVIGEDAETH